MAKLQEVGRGHSIEIFFGKDRTIVNLGNEGRSNEKTTENDENRLPLRGCVGNKE